MGRLGEEKGKGGWREKGERGGVERRLGDKESIGGRR